MLVWLSSAIVSGLVSSGGAHPSNGRRCASVCCGDCAVGSDVGVADGWGPADDPETADDGGTADGVGTIDGDPHAQVWLRAVAHRVKLVCGSSLNQCYASSIRAPSSSMRVRPDRHAKIGSIPRSCESVEKVNALDGMPIAL